MLQRLQQRMEKKKVNVQETKPEVSSFYPDPESGMHLQCLHCSIFVSISFLSK